MPESGRLKAVTKQDVNLAICGHAWHGKSTLVGKAAAELGMIGRRDIEHYEQLARKGRDASLVFALAVFRSKDIAHPTEEAARGITVLPSFVRFEMKTHRVLVVDTPGQENYVNNRFFGMFSSDVALLLVDVRDGVKPVTEQILRILRGYEIPLRGVAVTKIDKVGYDETAFHECVEQVRVALKIHEIQDEDVQFFPTSAYAPDRSIFEPGEGVTRYQRIGWFKGPTFYDFMQSLDFRLIRPQSPLRVVIHSADIYDQVPGIGTAFTGTIESGVLKRDETLVFEPLSDERQEPVTAHVRSIELTKGHLATPGVPIGEAIPRQLIGCALRNVSTRESLRDLFKNRGVVAGTKDALPSVAHEIEAELTLFEGELAVIPGMMFTMHAHVDKVGVEIKAVTGGSGTLKAGEWSRVHLAPVRPIAIEEASKLAPLSKIVIREGNIPLGLGRCLKILR